MKLLIRTTEMLKYFEYIFKTPLYQLISDHDKKQCPIYEAIQKALKESNKKNTLEFSSQALKNCDVREEIQDFVQQVISEKYDDYTQS